ncbi:MAG: transcription factor TFIIIB subunit brf1 [Paramarteilia canceri]
MVSSCVECGGLNFEVDDARGDSFCLDCGAVQKQHESSFIVASVEFQESAGGAKHVVGQHINSEGFGKSSFGKLGGSRQSIEITFSNAKKIVNDIATQLHLPPDITDTGYNFYKMCYNRGLSRGRTLKTFCAACLYIACRVSLTSHMLIDFSQAVQVDVTSLGRFFSIICKTLHISLPLIDPSLYIPRFADKLNFGSKTQQIVQVAVNLVAGMQRDWMCTGRRPSGLCASSLLIAARLYGFNRTVDDILSVFKLHKATLLKRLQEFSNVSSGFLTYDELLTSDPSQQSQSSQDDEGPLWLQNSEEEHLGEQKKQKLREEMLKMCGEIDKLIETQVQRKPPKFLEKNNEENVSERVKDFVEDPKNLEKLSETELSSEVDDSEIENALLDEKEVKSRILMWKKLEDEEKIQSETNERIEQEETPPKKLSRIEMKKFQEQEETLCDNLLEHDDDLVGYL